MHSQPKNQHSKRYTQQPNKYSKNGKALELEIEVRFALNYVFF